MECFSQSAQQRIESAGPPDSLVFPDDDQPGAEVEESRHDGRTEVEESHHDGHHSRSSRHKHRYVTNRRRDDRDLAAPLPREGHKANSARAVFYRFADEDGYMDAKRLMTALHALGYKCSRQQGAALLSESDQNLDGVLTIDEFAVVLGKHQDFQQSVADDLASEICNMAKQVSADISRYRLLGRYLMLVAVLLVVLLAQRSSDGAASIGDSINAKLFNDETGTLDANGLVTDTFESSSHILTWLDAMVQKIYTLPTCGDSLCEGPEEFPTFNPANGAREFSPCEADCGNVGDTTAMISVRVNFDDVEKLRNAYERREALIKAGMWAGASVDYWGVDETTPLGGWCV